MSSSDLFCPSVSGRGPSSRFYLSTFSRLSQGTAYSYRVTLMVRPLLLAEPGPGDASCTIWTLSAIFHPFHLQAGRPSSKSAFSSRPVFQPLQIFRSFPAFSHFKSFDYPRLLTVSNLRFSTGFTTASNLLIFFSLSTESDLSDLLLSCDRFRSSGFLRSFDRSVLPAIPILRLVGFFLTGDLNYT